MDRTDLERLDRELQTFLGTMFEGMGRPERRRAMVWYVTGLLLDGERKSIEPMAARLLDAPSEAEAMRQRLQQCVSVSAWDSEAILCRLAQHLATELPQVEALVVDDTGFPKKGCPSQVSVRLGITRLPDLALQPFRPVNARVAVADPPSDRPPPCACFSGSWSASSPRGTGPTSTSRSRC